MSRGTIIQSESVQYLDGNQRRQHRMKSVWIDRMTEQSEFSFRPVIIHLLICLWKVEVMVGVP